MFGEKALHIDMYIRNVYLLESAKRVTENLDPLVKKYF
jgi:hypothetical protein